MKAKYNGKVQHRLPKYVYEHGFIC